MMEIRLILSMMLQHLTPTIPDGFEAEFLPQLALRPKNGLPILVNFRRTPPKMEAQ